MYLTLYSILIVLLIYIGYHIYADDTQFYISFKCKDLLESLTELNKYISDIRVWMIKNKGVVFDQYLTFHDLISGTHFHLRVVRLKIHDRIIFKIVFWTHKTS